MDPTYELISEQILTSNQSSITFNNIPSGYDDLHLLITARSSTGNMPAQNADFINLRLNGASPTSSIGLYGVSTTPGSWAPTHTPAVLTDPNTTSNTYSSIEFYIPKYSKSFSKIIYTTSSAENNGTAQNQLGSTIYSGVTSSINYITLTTTQNGSLISGSTFQLYGIKNADDGGRGFFGPAISGGNEVFTTGNGYKYHIFKSSGLLQVTSPGYAEVFIVGGGGGGAKSGGSTFFSGGGGGGGQVSSYEKYIPSGSIPVLIGAGGAGGTDYPSGTNPTNGGDTLIQSVATAIGGGAGGNPPSAGSPGASGGGGGYAGSGGISLSGQGAGASGNGSNLPGGGGGAGGNGNISSGGIGSAAYSSWGLATSTGQLSSSIYYYAGGGGGGYNTNSATPANGNNGGLGGGGKGGVSNGTTTVGRPLSDGTLAVAGTANTGGGGGGAPGVYAFELGGQNGANGGSGLVIIRYRI